MIILRSNIDLSTLTIFAAVCSGLQQIAAVDLFINITFYSSLQQIAAVDLFINNVLRSSLQQIAADRSGHHRNDTVCRSSIDDHLFSSH